MQMTPEQLDKQRLKLHDEISHAIANYEQATGWKVTSVEWIPGVRTVHTFVELSTR